MRRFVVPVALAAGLAGSGCAVGPDYATPELATPDLWEQQLTHGLQDGRPALETWWTLLEDPLLTSLVERAIEGNLDLRLALQRVEEARAERGFARGSWFPSIGNFGSYQRRQLSGELLPDTATQTGTVGNLYNYGFDATWEIDVFGRVRRQVEAANAELEATIEDYRDVLVLLVAEVGSTYVDVRTVQLQLRYARANAERQRETLSLTRDRSRAGLAPDLDVRQAELNLAETESTIPFFEESLRRAIHRLGVLIGAFPATLAPELSSEARIPQPPADVLVGVPHELLRQRPDVRSAERQLAAATARIGVAKADLFPRLSLLGQFAFQSIDAVKLFTGDAQAFSVGPAMQWNLFDGGRIRANIQTEDERAQQALTRYENTVLLALEEAENAMVAYQREWERRDALSRSVVAAQASVDLVMTLYRTGLTDFQNVLDMERSLFRQQDQLAASEGRVTLNLIRIYRALGGGWTP